MHVSSTRVDFYGRAAPLHELVGHAAAVRDTGRGRLLLVGGRRQVGKSRLLTEFVERAKTPYLYYAPATAAPAAPVAQMRAWLDAVRHSTTPVPEIETFFDTSPRGWSDAFARLAAACRNAPAIVVIDDVAVVRRAEPDFDVILAAAWERQLKRCPVLLVVVGPTSITGAGRMVLDPLNPAECAHALGRTSAMDAFDAYLVTGGYPRLVAGCARAMAAAAQTAAGPRRRAADADVHADAIDYVRSELHDENSDFVVTAERLLASELAESPSAMGVLGIIGSEDVALTSFSRIVDRLPSTGVTAQTAATRALKLLADRKSLVSVEIPVGAPSNTKLRRYHLDDPYLRFWCAFVRLRIGDIARGRADIAVNAFDDGWEAWRELAIVPVVRNSLRRMTLTMPEFTRTRAMGSWWSRDGSHDYDVVMAGDKTHPVVAVASVKWRSRKAFSATEQAELATARAVLPGAARARLVTICPAGVEPGVETDMVLDPEALLAAW